MPEREHSGSPLGDHLSEEEKQKLYEVSNSPSPEQQLPPPAREATEGEAELSPEERAEVDKDEAQARAKVGDEFMESLVVQPPSAPTQGSEQIGTPTSPNIETKETPPPTIESKPITQEKEKPEQPRPEITAEIIKETALKVRETYRDALDTGATEKEAAVQSQTKLNELTANIPGFRTSVLREIQRSAKQASPENLPTQPPVAETPSLPTEKPAEVTPVETKEERQARTEQDIITQHLAERGEREAAPLPPVERKISEEKESMPIETEKPEAPSDLTSEVAQEGLEIYQKTKTETGNAVEAFDKAQAYIKDKLKEYGDVSYVLSWCEMRGNIPDSDFPPEPEPTPEEKEGLAEAEATAAEVLAETIEKASEPEPAPADGAEEIPDALKPIEAQETKEPITVTERVNKELAGFGITPEQTAEIPGFNDLSEGRQLLVIENLKQVTLGRIQEEAKVKFKTDTAQVNMAGKIWRHMFKKAYGASAEKETAKEIIHGGLEKHKEVLTELVSQAMDGPEAELTSEGNLEIHYLNPDLLKHGLRVDETITDEDKQKIAEFNKVSAAYSRIPREWFVTNKKHEKIDETSFATKKNYEDLRQEVMVLLFKKLEPGAGVMLLNQVESQIKINQFLNTNPEIEKALQNVEYQRVWTKVLTGTAKERLLMSGGGYAIRAGSVALLGTVGLPLTLVGIASAGLYSAVIGAARAITRTKESQEEREKAARHGQEKIRKSTEKLEGEKGKTVSQFVKAEKLVGAGYTLMEKIEGGGTTEKFVSAEKKTEGEIPQELTPEKRAGQLLYFAQYIEAQLRNGTINFGTSEVGRLKNQYELVTLLGKIKAYKEMVTREDALAGVERAVKISEKQKETKETKKEKELKHQILKGAAIGAGFAIGGYALRAFGEVLGWWGKTIPHGEKPDLHLAALEKDLHINSKDGIDQTEFGKIVKHLTQLQKEGRVEEVDSIRKNYGGMEVKGTSRTVEETLKELAKRPASAGTPPPPETPPTEKTISTESKTMPPESAEKSGVPQETPPTIKPTAQEVPEIKPSVSQPLESILPQLNHAETIHEGGNVWNTTRDMFLYRSPEKLKELGFDVPRTDPEFGEKLSHWADAKTSELLNQYAREHGGHMPDVVHEGDKVLVEFKDGKLDLKVLDSHGNELEPSSTEIAEEQAESKQPPMSDEETKALEEKLQQRVMEEGLPKSGITPMPPIETLPVTETPKTPLTELVQKLKETESLIGNQETKITNAVKEYVASTINSEKYAGLKIDGEKLNTFAHMFPMKGIAENIDDLDTPEELAKAIELFNNKLHLAAETLIRGEMKGLTVRDSPFPVESMDGARIYFAKPLGNNEWGLVKYDQTGQHYQDIQNPSKNFWAGDKLKFNLKDVIKILGYKK